MIALDSPSSLTPDETMRLTAFARACKAAQRAVLLYPEGHTAVSAALGRLVDTTSPKTLTAPLRISVMADGLLLEGRAPAKPDAAMAELAALLHAHLVGELTVQPGGDARGWHRLLTLLGRAPDAVRGEGGIARAWTAMAGVHVEIREVDYAEVLRERPGQSAAWEQIIAACLEGQSSALSDLAVQGLLDIVRDAGRLSELVTTLEARATAEGGVVAGADALLRLLSNVVASVQQLAPDEMEVALGHLADALSTLTPEVLTTLVAPRQGPVEDEAALVATIVQRMSDGSIAQFVARHAMGDDSSLERVAEAFHALVPESIDRDRLLSLAHDEAAASPFGDVGGFEQIWGHVAERLMTSYSDKPFVSQTYARELAQARTKALDLERMQADPPDRVSHWLGTVTTSALRELDQTLVLDLLQLEEDAECRLRLVHPVASLIEAHVIGGHFSEGAALAAAVARDRAPGVPPARRKPAEAICAALVAGSMMQRVVEQLATIDDARVTHAGSLCVSVGGALVTPLAEALSREERPRTRERLTRLLVAYGATGRQEVERLKASSNPSVRRTAVYLLREFGGSDALPELAELLDDAEPQVQREAVRAILNIGTEPAYRVLEVALTSGSNLSREAMMQAVGAARDERATPLFAYILRNVDHRGPLGGIYLRAIDALGVMRDPNGVPALAAAITRGEWWAPRRTASLRRAVASALVKIGTPEALDALEEAARTGSRGVRAAAKSQLAGRRSTR